jgi:hypothetical protein
MKIVAFTDERLASQTVSTPGIVSSNRRQAKRNQLISADAAYPETYTQPVKFFRLGPITVPGRWCVFPGIHADFAF